jgi:hypothetical protein
MAGSGLLLGLAIRESHQGAGLQFLRNTRKKLIYVVQNRQDRAERARLFRDSSPNVYLASSNPKSVNPFRSFTFLQPNRVIMGLHEVKTRRCQGYLTEPTVILTTDSGVWTVQYA